VLSINNYILENLSQFGKKKLLLLGLERRVSASQEKLILNPVLINFMLFQRFVLAIARTVRKYKTKLEISCSKTISQGRIQQGQTRMKVRAPRKGAQP